MRKLFLLLIQPILFICDIIDLLLYKIHEIDNKITLYLDKKLEDYFNSK